MLTGAIMAQITKRHQGPSMTRARFDDGFQCLHEVLTPFVNSPGWLHYVEKPEQPVKAPILIAHKVFFVAKSLHENLPEPRLHQKCGHPGVSAALGREGVGHGQA